VLTQKCRFQSDIFKFGQVKVLARYLAIGRFGLNQRDPEPRPEVVAWQISALIQDRNHYQQRWHKILSLSTVIFSA
jgi:hypothetical protein